MHCRLFNPRGTGALSETSPGRQGASSQTVDGRGCRGETTRLVRPIQPPTSAFAGFRFPPDVILIAVRWPCVTDFPTGISRSRSRERGIEVDRVTLFRRVQRFTPLLIDAARPRRHGVGGHWFIDETYVKVSGTWRYVYRAVDQYGLVIDVFMSKERDLMAPRRRNVPGSELP
jgi:IS6 family transposase